MTQTVKCDQQYASSFMTPESRSVLLPPSFALPSRHLQPSTYPYEKVSSSTTVSILILSGHTVLRNQLEQAHCPAPGGHSRMFSFYVSFTPRSPSFSTPRPRSATATPTRIRQSVSPSRLSSPFVERNLTEESTPTKITTPRKSPQLPPSPVPSLNPVFVNDVFSQYIIQTELIAPSPLRVLKSETSLLTDPHLSKIEEIELYRPDCLKRAQRTPSPLVNSSLPDDPFSHVPISLGVTETPARGRRLKLFQETSEESFERSLMVNGYAHRGGVGHNGQLSQTTLDWLCNPISTIPPPHRPCSSIVPSILPSSNPPLTETETKKRKWLESFLPSPPCTSKLRIVDVEGRGRILLNAEEEANLRETFGGNPVRRRRPVGKRKLKGNGNRRTSQAIPGPPHNFMDAPSVGPDWLDTEFPWSLKADQLVRAHWETQAEKMRWVDKFLDRESDSESEGEEIMPSSAWGELYQHPPMPCRRGRGKMVPIKATDRRRTGTMVFPSDPADARAALLSRRAVRAWTLRRALQSRHSNPSSEKESGEDEVFCICEGKVKDRGLVQCDDCERWYHLRCIGVRNIGELGGPDDPWYCTGCMRGPRQIITPEPAIPSSEPTIVPTDDDCPGSSPKDPLFFAGSSERSPFPAWRPHARLSTPTRSSAAFEPLSGSSSTAYSNRGDPSTPQNPSSGLARIYETPSLSINIDSGESTFDLATTPSRGMKFSAFTPKSVGPWSYNSRTNTTGVGFHTPSRKHTGSVNRLMGRVDTASGIAARPTLQDSPTRRKEGVLGRVLHSRRLHDSPMGFGTLTGGGRLGGFPMLEESPVVRSAGKKRMREEVDLGDGVPVEE